MVIREWKCGDCGTVFESSDAPEDVACPTCSADEPERVFLTPPAVKSSQTSRKDEIVKDLAQAHGMSDMSNRGGTAVRSQASPPATFAPSAMNVLNNLRPEHRDGFSPFLGKFEAPNRALANQGFPFEKRTRLKPVA